MLPPKQGIVGMAALSYLLDVKGDALEAASFMSRAQFYVKWWMDNGIVSNLGDLLVSGVMTCWSWVGLCSRTQMVWLRTTG